jgi:hypothetical protein
MPALPIFGCWGRKQRKSRLRTLLYVFVNLRKDSEEYVIVPSRIVSERLVAKTRASGRSKWQFIYLKDIERYRDKWPTAGRNH